MKFSIVVQCQEYKFVCESRVVRKKVVTTQEYVANR